MTLEDLLRYRLDHYRRHRNGVGEKLVRAVLRASGTVEAAQTVNRVMENMELLDLELDVREVAANAETVLRAEVMAILAQHAHLPRATKQAIVDRVVARMVPLRDGATGGATRTRPPELARHENLARRLEREAAAIQRGEGAPT